MQEAEQSGGSQEAQAVTLPSAEAEVDEPGTPPARGSEGKLQALRTQYEATQVEPRRNDLLQYSEDHCFGEMTWNRSSPNLYPSLFPSATPRYIYAALLNYQELHPLARCEFMSCSGPVQRLFFDDHCIGVVTTSGAMTTRDP